MNLRTVSETFLICTESSCRVLITHLYALTSKMSSKQTILILKSDFTFTLAFIAWDSNERCSLYHIENNRGPILEAWPFDPAVPILYPQQPLLRVSFPSSVLPYRLFSPDTLPGTRQPHQPHFSHTDCDIRPHSASGGHFATDGSSVLIDHQIRVGTCRKRTADCQAS